MAGHGRCRHSGFRKGLTAGKLSYAEDIHRTAIPSVRLWRVRGVLLSGTGLWSSNLAIYSGEHLGKYRTVNDRPVVFQEDGCL